MTLIQLGDIHERVMVKMRSDHDVERRTDRRLIDDLRDRLRAAEAGNDRLAGIALHAPTHLPVSVLLAPPRRATP